MNDGVIKKIGESKTLGNYLVLQDAYGNRFTYSELGEISEAHPVPKERDLKAGDFELISPDDDPAPDGPATDADPAGKLKTDGSDGGGNPDAQRSGKPAEAPEPELANTEDARERLYALPERPRNVDQASLSGQLDELLDKKMPAYESFKSYFSGVLKFDRKSMDLAQLREGSQVVAGTVLGRIGAGDEVASHVNFQIRPTGRGAPKIDPKPILDGWKLLEATAIYRAAGKDPFGFSERLDRPDPVALEGPAPAPGALRSAPRDLRLRPRGHRDRPGRPPHPRGDGVPRRVRLPPDDHLDQVRPQLLHDLRATSPRTPPGTRSTSPR